MTVTSKSRARCTNLTLAVVLACAAPFANAQAPAAPAKTAFGIKSDARTFRLTYTVSELDGTRRLGVQHFTLVGVTGGRTTLKQGSKIPLATGTNKDSNGLQTQFTYIDVGINIDASLDDIGSNNRVSLRSKIEQSGIAEEKTISGVTEPVIRQTVLEGTSILTEGQPLTLGSVDIPGSTRHLDVEVLLEPSR